MIGTFVNRNKCFPVLYEEDVSEKSQKTFTMIDYAVLDEFLLSITNNHITYSTKIKAIEYKDYKPYQTFRVEYKRSDTGETGVIEHLTYMENIFTWTDSEFPDKHLCQLIGDRIIAYYYKRTVLLPKILP
jgi:hypothetical protein